MKPKLFALALATLSRLTVATLSVSEPVGDDEDTSYNINGVGAYINGVHDTYDCNGTKIYRYSEDWPEGPSEFVEHCIEGCKDFYYGATCLPKAPPAKRASDGTTVNDNAVTARYNECTSDQRGVRTCEYGFCYVEPGNWCGARESCSDDCKCCLNSRILARRVQQRDGITGRVPGSVVKAPKRIIETKQPEDDADLQPHARNVLGAELFPPEQPRKTFNPSPRDLDDPASLPESMALSNVKCTMGTFSCFGDRIGVCGWYKVWELAYDCPSGKTCALNHFGHADCVSSKSKGEAEGQTEVDTPEKRMPLAATGPIIPSKDASKMAPRSDESGCASGAYRCGGDLQTMYVCDILGRWQISAVCGAHTVCLDGPNLTAHCVAVGPS